MSFPAPKKGQAPDNAVHSREDQAVMDPTGERPRHNNAMGSQLCILFFFFQSGRNITVPTDNSYDASRHLNFQDLAVDDLLNLLILRIRLKYSKTDQLGSGLDIVLGRTYQDVCPVAAAMAYLAVRRDGEGPLFKFADRQYLTKEHFIRCIRETLAALGLRSEDYAGHSSGLVQRQQRHKLV